ncbi:MAG: hypothetical protein MJ211_11940 [Bacteroidales bacterium]|nr:hypothetical protein [Bacteroidales bacterium]
MEILQLTGTSYERVTQALEFAKKHNKHKPDMSKVEAAYAKAGVPLIETVRKFYEEYGGVFDDCELCTQSHREDGTTYTSALDFTFAFVCNSDYQMKSINNSLFTSFYASCWSADEYEDEDTTEKRIDEEFAALTENTDTYYIGEIGYYYPAEVWMNAKGKMFVIHDYEDGVIHKFADFAEFISWELQFHSLDAVKEK